MPDRDDDYVDFTYFVVENAFSQSQVLANTEIKHEKTSHKQKKITK
jgi:hypothetical protein